MLFDIDLSQRKRCDIMVKHTILRCALVILALALSSKTARALHSDFKLTDKYYVPTGFNLGVAMAPERPVGLILGGEMSLVYLHKSLLWTGAYTDLVYDFGNDARRFSIGPEVGCGFFGLDGGYLVSSREEETHHGFQLRAVLTIASFMALGLRWGHLVGEVEHPNFSEINLIFKFPFPMR